MGYHDKGAAEALQVLGQPGHMLLVQEIRRLVQQQHIRSLQQQLGQDRLGPLPAAQGGKRPLQAQGGEPQPCRHLGNARLQGIEVRRLQLPLAGVNASQQGLILLPGQLLHQMDHPLLRLIQPFKGAVQQLIQGDGTVGMGMLIQIAQARLAVPNHLARIRQKRPGQNADKRTLACAVLPDDAHMLAGIELESRVGI